MYCEYCSPGRLRSRFRKFYQRMCPGFDSKSIYFSCSRFLPLFRELSRVSLRDGLRYAVHQIGIKYRRRSPFASCAARGWADSWLAARCEGGRADVPWDGRCPLAAARCLRARGLLLQAPKQRTAALRFALSPCPPIYRSCAAAELAEVRRAFWPFVRQEKRGGIVC